MALIKCPECGQEVSSTAGRCVHCGCQFSVCPECGTVTVGEMSMCNRCGYRSEGKSTQKADEKSEAFQMSATDQNDIVTAWKNRNQLDNNVLRAMNVFRYVAAIIAAAFLVMGSISFTAWTQYDGEKQLFKMSSMINTVRAGFILFAVFMLYDFVKKDLVELYTQLRCATWLRKQRFDALKVLEKSAGATEATRNDLVPFDDLRKTDVSCRAAYYAANQNEKIILLIRFAVIVLSMALTEVFIVLTVIQNVETGATAIFFELEFVFQWKMVIGAAVAFVAGTVADILIKRAITKKYKTWLYKQSPALYEAVKDIA